MPHKNIAKRKKKQPGQHPAPEVATPETTGTSAEHTEGNDHHADRKNLPAQPPRFWSNPNHWIAVFTVLIAIANGFYAWFAYQQMVGAHLDQRAWIGVEKATLSPMPLQVGKPMRITLNFRNTGKTPALDLVGRSKIDPVTRGAMRIFSYPDTAHMGVLPPNGTNFVWYDQPMGEITRRVGFMTTDLISDIDLKNTVIYLHGCVMYKDAFKKPHWMTYCYLLMDSSGIVGACQDHNDIDKDSEPPPEYCMK